MGLAASQARLLTITARLADNELRSQTINNAKMRLATQSSQASENYVNALNQASLMFTNYDSTGAEQSQLLTFNALTGYSQYNNQYGLANAAGMILVSENDAVAFEKANGNLNAFLKSKGLEYNTTYFEELCGKEGSYVNELYPEPFKKIGVDELQAMYEAYGSYEHSVEMEEYDKLYSAYTTASEELNKAVKELMPGYLKGEYIKNEANSPAVSSVNGSLTLNTNKWYDFKNAMTGSNNNTYNINNLKNKGYITKDAYNYFNNFFNQVNGKDPMVTVSGTNLIVKEKFETTLSHTEAKGENPETYTLDDEVTFTKDKTTGCWTVTLPDSGSGKVYDEDEEGKQILAYTYSLTGGIISGTPTIYTDIKDVISKLQVSEGTSVSTFEAQPDSDGNMNVVETLTSTYSTNDEKKEFIDSLFHAIYDCIINQDGVINDQQFINGLLEDTTQKITGEDATVLKSGKTLNEIKNTFESAKQAFFQFIDANASDSNGDYKTNNTLENLLNSGKIIIKDLQDLDFTMKLLGGSVYDTDKNKIDASGVLMTSNFKTVVSDFIIKNMISETGEPKYAWVDENDTGNKGNADAKAQWYTNLFNRMKQGYKTLENGLASSPEWMEFALQTGIVTVEQVDKTYNWKSIDYKTCSKITEQTDNSAAVAKAEAEYSRAMNDINAKDSIYDIELKNIDTEHTALQTEYESIKGVINKNIERVFKFNQNG